MPGRPCHGVPYALAIMTDPSPDHLVQGDAEMLDEAKDGSRRRRRADKVQPRLVPSGKWLTGLAFAVVALPFLVALVELLRQSGAHLTLADDVALIDLHTRRALAGKQQLGVFDRNNWNHPGPSYFYLQSVVYRVLGGGERALFVGATLLNGLCALGCVAIVRYRSTPARALWAAVWICGLVGLLAASGPASTTYSETVLGALVSPWNPMVVIFPLLLTVLFCAAAVDRSGLSLLAAALTGSFVVQTDISAAPVVAVVGGVAAIVWAGTCVFDLVGLGVGKGAVARRHTWWDRRHWIIGPILALATLLVLCVMWLPPLAQQRANHPGNFTLIIRFFNGQHGTYPLIVGWKSLLSVNEILIQGPGVVMRANLGLVVAHAGIAWTSIVVTGLAATAALVVGWLQHNRFALGLGLLVLAGSDAVVVSATHVVGYVFGYLLVWAVVLPIAALIAPGLLTVSWGGSGVSPDLRRPVTGSRVLRLALCALAAAMCVAVVVRVNSTPPLTRASDPNVGSLVTLVTPYLEPGGRVFVGDGGAGTANTQLLDTEEFIGLVNLLDQNGFRPTVNHVWRTQFGPGFQSTGQESRQVILTTWVPNSPAQPGYVGKAGDMAVTVTDGTGAPVGRTPSR